MAPGIQDPHPVQKKVRYEELLPYEWAEIMRVSPIVYWPLGLIEWHGEHLAVGNDAVKADALCLQIAQRYGGIVYPASYFGYERSTPWDPIKYGLNRNIDVDEELFRRIARRTFRQFDRAGFKVVVAITGHYPREQPSFLKEEAEAVMRSTHGRLKIWALADYEPVTDLEYTGDHAAKWETSILMHLRPDLVEMDRLPGSLDEKLWGVGGLDPRVHASPEVGRAICEAIVERIGKHTRELLAELSPPAG
jgi:creatinine amidohydrolase